MAMDFPNSPTIGQQFTNLDRTWQWTGTQWISVVTAPQPPYPGRNRIINGGFDVWQRGPGPFAMSGGGYTSADMWPINGGGSTISGTRQAFTPGNAIAGYEPTFFHRSVITSVAGAGNYGILQTGIEGVRTFAGQTVTLSFFAKADTARSIAVELEQRFGGGSATVTGIGSTKIPITATWARYSVTINVPSITGKTIGSGPDAVWLNLWFDAGSNYNARTGTLGQQSGTFDIWGVQLEAGSVATPFEVKPYGDTLRDCQRYFRVFGGGAIYEYVGAGKWNSATQAQLVVQHDGMRASPSLTVSGPWQITDAVNPGVAVTSMSGSPFGNNSSNSMVLFANVASGGVAYRPVHLEAANSSASRIFLSAEL